tara:strand:+ start:139 stop:558 length:420 start_codon:yes stop_codon:yes gene_type:complete
VATRRVIIGILKFAIKGCICSVEPKAFNRLDIKYKKNIIIKEFIIVLDILSFCLSPWTREKAKKTRDEIKKGKLISPYKCILKSTAEYPSSSRKLINVINLHIDILEGEERLSAMSSDLIFVKYFRLFKKLVSPYRGEI